MCLASLCIYSCQITTLKSLPWLRLWKQLKQNILENQLFQLFLWPKQAFVYGKADAI